MQGARPANDDYDSPAPIGPGSTVGATRQDSQGEANPWGGTGASASIWYFAPVPVGATSVTVSQAARARVFVHLQQALTPPVS